MSLLTKCLLQMKKHKILNIIFENIIKKYKLLLLENTIINHSEGGKFWRDKGWRKGAVSPHEVKRNEEKASGTERAYKFNVCSHRYSITLTKFVFLILIRTSNWFSDTFYFYHPWKNKKLSRLNHAFIIVDINKW